MAATGDHISVLCGCGKKLKAPATAVGRKAKCPSCGNVLTIEAPPPPPPQEQEDDPFGALYDLAEAEKKAAATNQIDDSSRCPKCGASMGSGAVLCVNCGYDLRGKKAIPSAAPQKPVVDYASSKSTAKKSKDRMAPDGSIWIGLLVSIALAIVGGIIYFFVTWGTKLDISILCTFIGILAGVGMQIGQKGYSNAGGWVAMGVTLVVMLTARFAVVVAIIIPIVQRDLAARAAARSAALASLTAQLKTISSTQPSSSGNTSNAATAAARAAAMKGFVSAMPPPLPKHSAAEVLGDLAFSIIFLSKLGILFMILAMAAAWRAASGNISG
jgi:ribosomal protein L40E